MALVFLIDGLVRWAQMLSDRNLSFLWLNGRQRLGMKLWSALKQPFRVLRDFDAVSCTIVQCS